MRLLDEQYLRTPFYGIRRMTAWLQELSYYETLTDSGYAERLFGKW